MLIDYKNPKVLLDARSEISRIKVVEDGTIRYLIFGDKFGARYQSAIDVSDLSLDVCPYTYMATHSLLMVNNPSNILVIGLGGGIIPRKISNYLPKANIDIIEIDPAVVDVAKKYFFFKKTDRMHIHCMDAFALVRQIKDDNRYDIVIIDAFSDTYVPYHLMCAEFLSDVKRILKPDGIVASDVWGHHPSYDSYVRTFSSVFGKNIYFMTAEEEGHANVFLHARKDGKDLLNKVQMTPEIKNSKIMSLGI